MLSEELSTTTLQARPFCQTRQANFVVVSSCLLCGASESAACTRMYVQSVEWLHVADTLTTSHRFHRERLGPSAHHTRKRWQRRNCDRTYSFGACEKRRSGRICSTHATAAPDGMLNDLLQAVDLKQACLTAAGVYCLWKLASFVRYFMSDDFDKCKLQRIVPCVCKSITNMARCHVPAPAGLMLT